MLGPASGTLALAGAGKLSLDELLNQRLGGTGFVTDIGYAPSAPRCGLGRPFARHGKPRESPDPRRVPPWKLVDRGGTKGLKAVKAAV